MKTHAEKVNEFLGGREQDTTATCSHHDLPMDKETIDGIVSYICPVGHRVRMND